MSLEKLLETLKSGASTKQSKTLDTIFEVCLEQLDRGSSDFTYTTISRIGATKGVPKAQSIRNKTGERYQALIQGFSEHSNSKTKGAKKTSELAWIDEISNPKIRLFASMQHAELKEAKRLVREIVPPGTTIIIDDRKSGITQHRLTEVERRALEFLASDEFLREWGYTAGERGEVLDESGSRKFKPGTLDALRKALRYL